MGKLEETEFHENPRIGRGKRVAKITTGGARLNGVALGGNNVYGGRMKMPLLRFGAILLLAMLPWGGLLAAEDYAIRLEPAQKAGDKYRVVGKIHDVLRQKVMADGDVVREQTKDEIWDFEGRVEVLAVDARELATKLKVEVMKMTLTKDGKTSEVFPSGTIINGSLKDGLKTFHLKEDEVEKSVSKYLKYFVALQDATEPTNDEVLGTKQRKKVGEVWPINGHASQKSLASMQVEILPEDLTGETKLEDTVDVAGQKHLKISSRLIIKKMLPKGPAWDKVKVQSATAEAKASGLYAVKDHRCLSSSVDNQMKVVAIEPTSGGRVVISAEQQMKTEKKFQY
jgi:hypothetical protein